VTLVRDMTLREKSENRKEVLFGYFQKSPSIQKGRKEGWCGGGGWGGGGGVGERASALGQSAIEGKIGLPDAEGNKGKIGNLEKRREKDIATRKGIEQTA